MEPASNPNDVHRFEGFTEAQHYLSLCTETASRHIDLFSDRLDHSLFCHQDFIDNLSRLARTSRQSRIRILIQSSQYFQTQHSALINLIQRLPSHISLRVLHKDCDRLDTAFCIRDSKALVFFNNERNAIGFYCEQGRAEARHALEQFNRLWETQSHCDPELKILAT